MEKLINNIKKFSEISQVGFMSCSEYLAAMEEWQKSLAYLIRKQEEEIFSILEKQIIENAIPKIKGNITAGKAKYRGLKLCIQNNGFSTTYWIEQRGTPITSKVEINFSTNL